MYFCLFLFLFY